MEPRAAWLLQVCRVVRYPNDTRRTFVRTLREAGFTADEWMLTRWESGEQKIQLEAAVEYDAVLHEAEPRITAALAYIKSSPMRSGRNSRERPMEELSQRRVRCPL